MYRCIIPAGHLELLCLLGVRTRASRQLIRQGNSVGFSRARHGNDFWIISSAT
jgi:hypothetical protein